MHRLVTTTPAASAAALAALRGSTTAPLTSPSTTPTLTTLLMAAAISTPTTTTLHRHIHVGSAATHPHGGMEVNNSANGDLNGFTAPPKLLRRRHSHRTLPLQHPSFYGGRFARFRAPQSSRRMRGKMLVKDPVVVQFNMDVWNAQQTLRKKWKGRDWDVVEVPFELAPKMWYPQSRNNDNGAQRSSSSSTATSGHHLLSPAVITPEPYTEVPHAVVADDEVLTVHQQERKQEEQRLAANSSHSSSIKRESPESRRYRFAATNNNNTTNSSTGIHFSNGRWRRNITNVQQRIYDREDLYLQQVLYNGSTSDSSVSTTAQQQQAVVPYPQTMRTNSSAMTLDKFL